MLPDGADHAPRDIGRLTPMMRLVRTVMALGLLAAATPTWAGCRWFGTQLDCDLGASQVVLGTQAEDEPAHARPFAPQGLHGGSRLLDDPVGPERPFRIELQNIGADPRLCRAIGNETYCY
jgi:hypothetical protein